MPANQRTSRRRHKPGDFRARFLTIFLFWFVSAIDPFFIPVRAPGAWADFSFAGCPSPSRKAQTRGQPGTAGCGWGLGPRPDGQRQTQPGCAVDVQSERTPAVAVETVMDGLKLTDAFPIGKKCPHKSFDNIK
jgi:hypothetical protein